MTRLPYPPCMTNIMTDKSFTSHKWRIKYGLDGNPVLRYDSNGDPFYHIFCERCGFNDPKKERF